MKVSKYKACICERVFQQPRYLGQSNQRISKSEQYSKGRIHFGRFAEMKIIPD